MGLLDDIGKSINKVGKKTSEMASSAKLKLEINKHKSNIDKKYEALGARIYFLSKENLDRDEVVDMIIEDIDGLNLAIMNLEKEIEAIITETLITDHEECSSCGVILAEGVKYCNACGARRISDIEKKVCPNCQAEVGRVKFCNECGASVNHYDDHM